MLIAQILQQKCDQDAWLGALKKPFCGLGFYSNSNIEFNIEYYKFEERRHITGYIVGSLSW